MEETKDKNVNEDREKPLPPPPVKPRLVKSPKSITASRNSATFCQNFFPFEVKESNNPTEPLNKLSK
jgi:hypothetical protein